MATDEKTGSGAVRQCAASRVRRPVQELIRFCLDPEGRVVPDLRNRLPGRGVWLTAARRIVAEAVAKGLFAKGFGQAVGVDAELPERVGALLRQAPLDRLSLANKAGLVAAGATRVAEAVARGQAAVLVHASDAAPGGREKIDAKAGPTTRAVVTCFSCRELSLALGRTNVIHAAVSSGGACDAFLRAVARFERYEAPDAAFAAA